MDSQSTVVSRILFQNVAPSISDRTVKKLAKLFESDPLLGDVYQDNMIVRLTPEKFLKKFLIFDFLMTGFRKDKKVTIRAAQLEKCELKHKKTKQKNMGWE